MLYAEWLGTGTAVSKDEIRFDCPKCDDEGMKFYWNSNLHIGHCFKCNFAANPYRLSRVVGIEYKSIPVSLRKSNKVPEETVRVRSTLKGTETKVRIPNTAIFDSIKGISYLLARGVTVKQMKKYDMRWEGSRFMGRVVLPIKSRHGTLIGWVGRSTHTMTKPKYLFSPHFPASHHLFGLNHFNPVGKELVLVEGPLDQIRFGNGSVATFGKSLSEKQKGLLLHQEVAPSTITIMWDPDARIEAIDLAERLSKIFKRIKVVHLPFGTDPGSTNRTKLKELVNTTPLYKSDNWKLECLKSQ